MYKKNIYVILFKNGIAKAGYSSDISRRISQHRSAAKAMASDIDRIWITINGHENIDKVEAGILTLMSEKLKPQTKEFFSGATVSLIRKIIGKSKLNFLEALSVSGKSGGRLVVEIMEHHPPRGQAESSGEHRESDKDKLLKCIAENQGITAGVIRSRYRHLEKEKVNSIIEELESESLILLETSIHEYSKKQIVRLFAC